MLELEKKYKESLALALAKAKKLDKADLVIGVPVLTESDAGHVLKTIEAGLAAFFPELKTVVAFCSTSFEWEKERGNPPLPGQLVPIIFDDELLKKGWATRALMELSLALWADLVLLEPTLFILDSDEKSLGLSPDWIQILYQPVLDGNAQLVLPRCKVSILENSIPELFVFPLLGALYNLELRACLGTGLAICRNLLYSSLSNADWPLEALEYGIDTYILLLALEQGAKVAEVFMGQKPAVTCPVGLSLIFSQTVGVLFKATVKKPQEQSWRNKTAALHTPLVFGARENFYIHDTPYNLKGHIDNFRRGFSRFGEAVWSRIFSTELNAQLREMAEQPEESFYFPPVIWAQIVYDALIAYHFLPELEQEDIARSLAPLFEGRLAGFLNEIATREKCGQLSSFCPFFAFNRTGFQLEAFIARKQHFLQRWNHQKEALQPFLPEIAYFEYIPGVPIVLPLTITTPQGLTKNVSAIYEQLLNERKLSFEKFTEEALEAKPEEGSEQIGMKICKLMQQIEEDFNALLLPGDAHTYDGMKTLAEAIFNLVTPAAVSFSLKADAAKALLKKHPPFNLMTLKGCQDIDELLSKDNALDLLALTFCSEVAKYTTQVNSWLRENLKPEHFEISPIKPLVVNYYDFPALSSVKEAPILNHLTSRVVVSNLRPDSGGKFPKIRLLTTILKSIADAERFGQIWETFVRNHENFAVMVLNSIEGHWGMSAFSAHSIFEDRQHRLLQKRLKAIARHFQNSQAEDIVAAGQRLEKLVEGYHLGLTLPDGRFVTASLWSWASYSFKGGKGIPTPLSLLIERRSFNGELFLRCYEEIGGSREGIYSIIVKMMGQGRESEDLADLYLEAPKIDQKVIIEQKMMEKLLPAGQLQRSPFNPLLTPVKENYWENKYVLNCGAIRLEGHVYILYRAVGEDGISRLGLAKSKDGLQIDERLPNPVFVPGHESESMGCEDPRLIVLEGRIYMLYTAYDGITPQIAMASIAVEDFINYRWQQWHRHGLVFPGLPNKDAILFPEKFDGKFVMYHRIIPSIWIAFSETLELPWPKEGHHIILGTRSGMMWDAVKIGAGAQPLKTKYGWLLIYHGVDFCLCYRLGVFLTSLQNPAEILYRSPNPILGPETSYEIGVSSQCWVPNVVFTCGAVPLRDKEILDADDEILVYYGGADTVIGVASATVGELIPEKFRQEPS